MSVLGELKRRNVYKVGAAYLAVAWLIMQVISTVSGPLDLPDRFDTIVVVLLAIGFPVALFLAWAYELTPAGIQRTADVPAGTPAPGARRTLDYAIMAVLGLAVAVLLVDRFVLDSTGPVLVTPEAATVATPGVAGAGPAPDIPAGRALGTRIGIAVLPFRNLSTDADAGAVAEGLRTQITTELKRVPELIVTDPRAAESAAAGGQSLKEIAAVLGVGYVLEGSVQSSGGALRISAVLTRVADDAQLWDDTWDFGRTDAFAVRDAITESVGNALSVSLGVLQSRAPGMTPNVEAYTEYLTALGHSQHFAADDARMAIQHYERAIALDPDFVAAMVGLAQSFREMAIVEPDDEAPRWRQRAEETMAGARAAANDEIEVALIDAIQNFVGGNWLETAASIARLDALGMDRNADRSGTLGMFLLRVGRVDEAEGYMEEARAMDPLDPGVAYNLGTAYAMNGDVAAAMTEFDRGLEVAAGGPLTPVLLGATWLTPLAAHDRAELERRLDVIEDEDPLGIGDAMRQFLDDADAGLAEIRRRIHDDVDETTLAKALLAHFAVYFGDPDLGLQIMRSIPLDEPYLPLMLWDPGLAATRSLPGFKNLVEDMGLVPYWREYGWGDFCRPVGNEDFACE